MKILSRTLLENQLIKCNQGIGDINSKSKEGKLLIAAIAKLTTEVERMKKMTPHEVLDECVILANKVYNQKTLDLLNKK